MTGIKIKSREFKSAKRFGKSSPGAERQECTEHFRLEPGTRLVEMCQCQYHSRGGGVDEKGMIEKYTNIRIICFFFC